MVINSCYRHKMHLYWILVLLCTLSFGSSQNKECLSKKQVFAELISVVKVKHPSNIRLTWSVSDETSNITIDYDSRIGIGAVVLYDELTISVSSMVNPTTTTTTTTTTTATAKKSSSQNTIVSILVDITGWFRKRRSVSLAVRDECDTPSVHITVPYQYTNRFCVNNQTCFPTKCPLSFLSHSKLSDIPASNTILFSDKYCTLKKPEFWDQWIKYYFNVEGNKTNEYIYDDSDSDGLVNFLEYYGVNVFNSTTEESIRTKSIADVGTNPKKADSDGDLLLDGFEFVNKMDPKKKDSISDDIDGDGLTNLEEQIRNTNPLKNDTDNDGVSDGEEVRRKTNPLDPLDHGQQDKSLDTATVKLTIGDHSGSHSERYVIKVGDIEHQSPGFGLVGSKSYDFKPGNYTITIQHVASNLRTPDYDYRAHVQKIGGNATVKVYDPSRLLGYHHESNYDYTVGKAAELVVTMNCPTSSKRCGCLKSCEECESNHECYWTNTYCTKRSWLLPYTKFKTTCPCMKCTLWYREEKASDMTWLSDLNVNFKCPCRVTVSRNSLKEVDNPSNVKWVKDKSCNPNEPENCKKYHPGAMGCIRSEGKSKHGAAQQCCYSASGNILKAGTAGAGTPDKYYASTFAFSMVGHYWNDVRPYNWCCQDCKRAKECKYYINEMRKGSTDHCSN